MTVRIGECTLKEAFMEKVRSGEAVNIKASTWNAFVDAANWEIGRAHV